MSIVLYTTSFLPMKNLKCIALPDSDQIPSYYGLSSLMKTSALNSAVHSPPMAEQKIRQNVFNPNQHQHRPWKTYSNWEAPSARSLQLLLFGNIIYQPGSLLGRPLPKRKSRQDIPRKNQTTPRSNPTNLVDWRLRCIRGRCFPSCSGIIHPPVNGRGYRYPRTTGKSWSFQELLSDLVPDTCW